MSASVMTRPTPAPAGGTVTLRRGLATFAGSVGTAAAGFALAVVVGRSLGPAGAGVFFSIVALFTIASTVLKLGTDTAELWRIPQLLAQGRVRDVAPTLRAAMVPTTVVSLLAAVAMVVFADPLAQRLGGLSDPTVRTQLLWAAAGLAAMAPMSVLIAAT